MKRKRNEDGCMAKGGEKNEVMGDEIYEVNW